MFRALGSDSVDLDKVDDPRQKPGVIYPPKPDNQTQFYQQESNESARGKALFWQSSLRWVVRKTFS